MKIAFEIDEKLLNVYIGLTGSGPAYLATFIEVMMLVALKTDIPRDIALLGAAQVAIGTDKLMKAVEIATNRTNKLSKVYR